MSVTPVVGRTTALPPLTPGTGEVARIFFIPVDDLARPRRWSFRTERDGDREIRFPCIKHDGETLWGLSARITLQLLELMGLGRPAVDPSSGPMPG